MYNKSIQLHTSAKRKRNFRLSYNRGLYKGKTLEMSSKCVHKRHIMKEMHIYNIFTFILVVARETEADSEGMRRTVAHSNRREKGNALNNFMLCAYTLWKPPSKWRGSSYKTRGTEWGWKTRRTQADGMKNTQKNGRTRDRCVHLLHHCTFDTATKQPDPLDQDSVVDHRDPGSVQDHILKRSQKLTTTTAATNAAFTCYGNWGKY